jgi:hypothetical protein
MVRNNSHFAHAAFVATFEPKDIGHALSDYNWVNSMHEELGNFERNQVWEWLTLPQGVSRLVQSGCRMDLPGPTTSVGSRTDYSVGPWDYPTCAARYLMA